MTVPCLKDRQSRGGDDHFANSFLISMGQQPVLPSAAFSGLYEWVDLSSWVLFDFEGLGELG